MGHMATGDLEETARLVRQVLTLAGLRDRAEDDHPGGFQVWTLDGQVTVDWVPVSALFDESQSLYRHASHPLVVFEGEVRATMGRAITSVLYAAGFTVTLRPDRRGAAANDEDSLSKLTVTAAPQIRVWASD
jgi:hypothetical protein